MTLIGTTKQADFVRHVYDLADPNVELDLSSEKWNLTDQQASVLVGRDVIRPGTFRIEGGRRPVGVSIPLADQPIVAAYGIDLSAVVPNLYQDHYNNEFTRGDTGDYAKDEVSQPPDTLLRKTKAPFAWPREMIGATLTLNEDSRHTAAERAVITDVITSINTDDSLVLSKNLGPGSIFGVNWAKFNILYWRAYDKRGVWVTNGRKFWLLQGGTYTQFLDLGDDKFLGAEWNIAKIATSLLMLVHPKYPCRILRLSQDATTDITDESSLAGLLPPTRPLYAEDPGVDVPSWRMKVTGASESLDAGTLRAKVRAVNIVDGAESAFVQVYDDADDTVDFLTVTDNNSVNVWTDSRNNDIGPVYHKRWTHLEFWRTLGDGVSYFLEKRIEIPKMPNESPNLTKTSTAIPATMIGEGSSTSPQVFTLADANLSGLKVLTADDIVAGGLPPICRRVASLGGITICMGKADSDAEDLDIDAVDWFSVNHRSNVDKTVRAVENSGWYTNYTVNKFGTKDNDRFEVVFGGVGAGRAIIGQYDIDSKVAGTNERDLLMKTTPGAPPWSAAHAFIRRNYTFESPRIQSDEDVWYSRVDLFKPESFPVRTIVVSRIGDTFRTMERVGNYIVVLMDSGVHLLYLAGSKLTKDTVAATGEGTPWENSAVVVGNTVMWATSEGIKSMAVSNEVNADGTRATIQPLGGRTTRNWFREAFDNGETIDAGLDTVNHCARWRRAKKDGTFQALQFSYRTGLWTLLDDDSGMRYASTTFAESTARTAPALYSIGSSGAAFEVNHLGISHPYDDLTVQATLDDSYTVWDRKIGKKGIFSPKMAGDVVRFRSKNAAIDGVARVIGTASANEITFDDVSGLKRGDEFLIGAARFRYRPAPLTGSSKSTIKTIEGVTLRALPGERNSPDGPWPDPPEGKITVRSYREYSDKANDEQDQEIEIFDEDDVVFKSESRESRIAGNGSAVELELEMIDTRTDFRLESVEVVVREEGDQMGDVTTDA